MNYLDHAHLFSGSSSQQLLPWLESHRDEVVAALRDRGVVLLRGFSAEGTRVAEEALRPLSPELLDDAFWSTPRAAVNGKTFTATEYPGPRTISLHSEMAYMTTWPRLLSFHSIVVADQGGQTTIGNLDDITRDLGDVVDLFADGVMYQRHYHPGVDIPWQTAFQTEDRAEVGKVAKRVGMELTWLEGDSLRTRHHAQGVVLSESGNKLWFNQAHLFHSSNLPEKDRVTLSELFGEDQLPRDALFGNGKKIPDEVVAKIHTVLEKHTHGIEWEPGDVALIDNMRYMHGRLPYSGSRKLHVAMAVAQSEPKRTTLLDKKRGGLAGLWNKLTG